MNIPTASEARRTVQSGQYDKAKRQAKAVTESITAAIAAGASQISRDGYLEAPVEAELKARGYTVKQNADQRDGDFTTISW